VTGSKVVVLLILGAVKLVFGLAPLIIARNFQTKRKNDGLKNIVGVVLCIGGGVLLSTVFIHMLVEVRESMERAKELGVIPMELEYPLAELIICLGFLFILLVEAVVHKWCGGHGHGHGEAYRTDTPQQFLLKIPEVPGSRSPYQNPAFTDDSSHDEKGAMEEKEKSGLSSHMSNEMLLTLGNRYSKPSNSYNLSTDSLAIQKTPSKTKHARYSRNILTSVREVMVVMALSVHSLFEGLAVGLEDSSGGVWQLFLAITIHSIAIVFCIGTDMVNNGAKQARIILSMVVLSSVTPIGVLVGILLTLDAHVQTGGDMLLMGVLQGLASGTLLYITFFEVLSREKLGRHGMSGLVGALFILFGFLLMAALNGLAGHSHGVTGHAHDHGLAGHSYGVKGHIHGHGLAGHSHGVSIVREHTHEIVEGDSFGEVQMKTSDNHGHGRHSSHLAEKNEKPVQPEDVSFPTKQFKSHDHDDHTSSGEGGISVLQQQHNHDSRQKPVGGIGSDSLNMKVQDFNHEGSDHIEQEEGHGHYEHNEEAHYHEHRGKHDHLFDYSTIN